MLENCVWVTNCITVGGVGSKFKLGGGGGKSGGGGGGGGAHFWIRKGHPQILYGYSLTIYYFE